MNKELTVRVQKLTKKLPQEAIQVSGAVEIKTDQRELFEKKGVLYAVFDLTSKNVVDPLLVKKIIKDVLADSYYSSESVSPIQSLERAIVDVKDKITGLSGLKTTSAKIEDFNMLVAAFWGNVVYMVQFGRGGSYLVRDNEIKPVNSATEGNFSVASGVVKDEDVIFLGTHAFTGQHSIEDLIGGKMSVSMHDLEETAAAMFLKFEMSAELGEDERIDFGLGSNDDEERHTQTIRKRPVENKSKSPSTIDLAKKIPSSLPKISIQSAQESNIPFKIIIPSVFGVLIVALGILNFDKIKNFGSGLFEKRQKEEVESSVVEEDEVEDENKQNEQENTEESTLNDEELKIERIDPEVFYDLKIVDEQSSPSDIVVLDSEVFVADNSSGKLFSSSISTPKFEEINTFSGIKSMSYFGGDLTFADNDGYKVYKKATGEQGSILEQYDAEGLTIVKPYLSFAYSVEGNKIIKYELLDSGLSGSDWTTSDDLSGAVSMAIDGSIYVLKNNELLKFYVGEKEDFSIIGLDKDLSNAKKVVKDIDFTNIYVADSGNNRVLVLDEDGNLIKQYVTSNDKFDDIKSISVSPDEDKLFVLSGTRVFEIDL